MVILERVEGIPTFIDKCQLIKNGLEKVQNLRGVEFDYTERNSHIHRYCTIGDGVTVTVDTGADNSELK